MSPAFVSRRRRLRAFSAGGLSLFALAAVQCSDDSKRPRNASDSGEGGEAPTAGDGAGNRPGSGGSGSGGGGSGGSGAGSQAGDDGAGSGGTGDTGSGGSSAGGASNAGGSSGSNGGSGGRSGAGASSGEGASAGCAGEECGPVGVCGNEELESGEGCDDGNALPFDGCSSSCEVEPSCDATGCEDACGDGLVVTGEDCDDGNAADGDGCSSACEVEAGFRCEAAACDEIAGQCVLRVPAIFRDFNAYSATGGHPDFEAEFLGYGVLEELVEPLLDGEGKPVLTAPSSLGFIHSAESFSQWYRDSAFNAAIPGEVVLWNDGGARYVNRWGKAGERWASDRNVAVTLPETDCGDCPSGENLSCQDPCEEYPLSIACCVEDRSREYDGNPLFFPIDDAPGSLPGTRYEGKVPEQYGWIGWPWESAVAAALGIVTPVETATAPFPSALHNFSFTSEVKVWFRYEAARNVRLEFTGDDDLWVFLNGRLVLDLGGFHVPLSGTVDLFAGAIESVATLEDGTSPATRARTFTASELGLEEGKAYPLAIFHAERQRDGSSFNLGLSGVALRRSVCVPE